ncbi:MAG: GNAT family N-acetyltransferase [Lachnospiraceae bacterium]|nr:GNAT family N-acetyltransferase [Lachnospiraceae bacterium]
MKKYEVIKNYRNDDKLRASFNDLAKKTFDLKFEDWYQNGYWGDNYNPYSIVIDGKVASNVSVNKTDFIWNGEKKHLIQLGTVMTEEKYRNQGLARQIMVEIEKDYTEADGIYLLANDSVLDFYPKFGFKKAKEFQYEKQVMISREKSMIQIPMEDKTAWDKLEEAIKCSVCYSSFELTDNSSLIMFYVTKFKRKNVYYDEELKVYAIAEIENGDLLIHNIFSEKEISVDKVIEAFGKEITGVSLGFTPKDKEGYSVSERKEEDTTLFLKGNVFDRFEQDRLMIPLLAHA